MWCLSFPPTFGMYAFDARLNAATAGGDAAPGGFFTGSACDVMREGRNRPSQGDLPDLAQQSGWTHDHTAEELEAVIHLPSGSAG